MRGGEGLVLLATIAGVVGYPALAHAQSQRVVVNVGRSLQLKSGDYGARDLDELTTELAATVDQALARSRAPGKPVQVQLVLEDATPNRPTMAELGRRPGLSAWSVGVGGAWVDGSVILPDGRTVPISFSFYESNLRDEIAPTVWSDADRAFEMLASDLAHGRLPHQAAPPVDTHSSFARWPG